MFQVRVYSRSRACAQTRWHLYWHLHILIIVGIAAARCHCPFSKCILCTWLKPIHCRLLNCERAVDVEISYANITGLLPSRRWRRSARFMQLQCYRLSSSVRCALISARADHIVVYASQFSAVDSRFNKWCWLIEIKICYPASASWTYRQRR